MREFLQNEIVTAPQRIHSLHYLFVKRKEKSHQIQLLTMPVPCNKITNVLFFSSLFLGKCRMFLLRTSTYHGFGCSNRWINNVAFL